MKIAFLCSSLAPGRNGVGDYVRCLAGALEDDGHVCGLFALHERQPAADERATRLSAALPWAQRAALLETALDDFAPDIVSWQMVPYGFHAKGVLPRGLLLLADATARWPRHVMLHEVWLGLGTNERWSTRVIGAWQRQRLLAFLRRVQPAIFHTSNAAYQSALHAAGCPAGRLPLFGNIPIVAGPAEEAETVLEAVVGAGLPPSPRWVAATFGTLHPQWNGAETLAWLRAAAVSAGRTALLLAIGRAGHHGHAQLVRLAREHPDIRIVATGPQSPAIVSQLLRASDFGIATHPWALIEKSGAAAAMCEHGLPVLVPRDDWHVSLKGVEPDPSDPLLARLAHVPPSAAASWLEERRAPASRLPAIATRLVRDLSGSLSGQPVSA